MNQHDDIFGMQISHVRAILADVCQQVAATGRPLAIRRYSRAHVVIVPLDEWLRLKELEASIIQDAIPTLSLDVPIPDTPLPTAD